MCIEILSCLAFYAYYAVPSGLSLARPMYGLSKNSINGIIVIVNLSKNLSEVTLI